MRIVSIAMLFIAVITTPSFAAVTEAVLSCFTRWLEAPYKKVLIEKAPNAIVTRWAGKPLVISTERQVGMGYFGTALLVKQVNNLRLRERIRTYRGKPLSEKTGVIVKIPNALKGTGSPLSFANRANHRELENFNLLQSRSAAIHQQMVADGLTPAWASDVLPTAPILASAITDRGTLLFKPMIRGKTLRDLREELVDGKLPKIYLDGLREYYAFAQATFKAVQPQASKNPLRRVFTKGYSIDIRPPNLVWIDDPATLASLGYSRPGFITYELSQVPFNSPHYIEGKGIGFEGYLAEFMTYL